MILGASFSLIYNVYITGITYEDCQLTIKIYYRGQTSVNKIKPGPSFQLSMWLHVCYALVLLQSKMAQLKVENLDQTTLGSLVLAFALLV